MARLEVIEAVKTTRQKTEAFVASLGDEHKTPVSIMGLGMMAGQMLGEYAAKIKLSEDKLALLIESFNVAFNKTTIEHYDKSLDGG